MTSQKLMRNQLAALFVMLLGACSPPLSPSQVYEEYNQRVIAGMPFEEEIRYYTERKQRQVEEQFPELMTRMNRSRAEVIEVYQRFSRDVARCTQITLADEKIEGPTAVLVYDQSDTCNGGTPGKQTIRLLNEDGWKIDDVEIAL